MNNSFGNNIECHSLNVRIVSFAIASSISERYTLGVKTYHKRDSTFNYIDSCFVNLDILDNI